MKTSPDGLLMIERFEGLRLEPYRDVAGKLTIGIGHLIKPHERFAKITVDEARALLAADCVRCEQAIERHVRHPLNQGQFDVLVSWAFNVGIGALADSTLVRELNDGHVERVPEQLLRWCKARVGGRVVVVEGLFRRRQAEAEAWLRASV